MSRVGGFTPDQAKSLWATHKKLLASGLLDKKKKSPEYRDPDLHLVPIYNAGSEAIPAYACCQVVGTKQLGQQTFLEVEKPTSTDGTYVFNTGRFIGDKGTGTAYAWGIVRMLGDVDSPSFEPGTLFIPVVGSWHIEEGDGPFEVFGPDRLDKKVLRGRFAGSGGGEAVSMIQFQFSESEYAEDTPADCASRNDGGHDMRVKVINLPCGGSVPGMDEEGYVQVLDPGEFLKDRDSRDSAGRTGFAMLLGPGAEEEEYGYDESGCQWVITWVNFFREVIMIKDIIFEENQIRIKRKKITVWDDCDLDDEIIEGTDCADEGY